MIDLKPNIPIHIKKEISLKDLKKPIKSKIATRVK